MGEPPYVACAPTALETAGGSRGMSWRCVSWRRDWLMLMLMSHAQLYALSDQQLDAELKFRRKGRRMSICALIASPGK